MTTATPEQSTRPRSWGETAVQLANDLAAEGFPRGDLAQLRRMDPDAPDAAAFWRLTARHKLLGNPTVERKWALVLNGIALMTRTAGPDPASRSAHDRNMPLGRALFQGGQSDRATAFYSESRLNRLLTARGPMLRTLLARLFRMMAAAGQSLDWHQMTQLILNDGHDEERADDVRRRIARDYYWAESRANRPQT